MPGIIPTPFNGGILVRDAGGNCLTPAGVSNDYCPDPAFTSSCEIYYLPDDCTARITAAQINGFQSEMLALAECFNPNGNWDCNSLTNLCANFTIWETEQAQGALWQRLQTHLCGMNLLTSAQVALLPNASFILCDGNGNIIRTQPNLLNPSVITNTVAGHRIATHTSGTGVITDIRETVTTIALVGDTIIYTDENGDETQLNLTPEAVTLACEILVATGVATDFWVSEFVNQGHQFLATDILGFTTDCNRSVIASENGSVADENSAVIASSDVSISGGTNLGTGTANTLTGINTFISGRGNTGNNTNGSLISGETNNATDILNGIVSGRGNTATLSSNVVLLGNTSTITNSSSSIVVGNQIDLDNSRLSAVFGFNNEVLGSLGMIVSGNEHNITNSPLSSVLGFNHTLTDSPTNGVTGANNILVGNSLRNLVGGSNNTLTRAEYNFAAGFGQLMTDSDYNGAIGRSNIMTETNYNFVLGFDNQLNGLPGDNMHGMIVNGHTNTFTGVTFDNILSGVDNTVNDAFFNAMFGSEHIVDNVSDTVIGGRNNGVTGGVGGSLITGWNHIITNSDYNTVGGLSHTVTNSSYNILSGLNHIVTGGADFNAVFGRDHIITNSDQNTVAGLGNTLLNTTYCNINGFANVVNGVVGDDLHGVMINGHTNIINDDVFELLINGTDNVVNGAKFTTVNGIFNEIDLIGNCIVNGRYLALDTVNTDARSIVGGGGPGPVALSSNRRYYISGTTGNAQFSGAVTAGFVFPGFGEYFGNPDGLDRGLLVVSDDGVNVRLALPGETPLGVTRRKLAMAAGGMIDPNNSPFLIDEWGDFLLDDRVEIPYDAALAHSHGQELDTSLPEQILSVLSHQPDGEQPSPEPKPEPEPIPEPAEEPAPAPVPETMPNPNFGGYMPNPDYNPEQPFITVGVEFLGRVMIHAGEGIVQGNYLKVGESGFAVSSETPTRIKAVAVNGGIVTAIIT